MDASTAESRHAGRVKYEDVVVEIAIPVTIPADFFDTWLGHVDLFMMGHCGDYWRLIKSDYADPIKGHLAWDFEQDDAINDYMDEKGVEFIDHLSQEDEDAYHAPAVQAWKDGKPLPPHYYAINKDVCTKAYIAGVKQHGTNWYEKGDGDDYSCAFQRAVYGEVVFG